LTAAGTCPYLGKHHSENPFQMNPCVFKSALCNFRGLHAATLPGLGSGPLRRRDDWRVGFLLPRLMFAQCRSLLKKYGPDRHQSALVDRAPSDASDRPRSSHPEPRPANPCHDISAVNTCVLYGISRTVLFPINAIGGRCCVDK